MRSTPDWATAWMVASEIPPEASNSTGTSIIASPNRFGHHFGWHVVQQNDVDHAGFKGQHRVELVQGVHFNLNKPDRPHGSGGPAGGFQIRPQRTHGGQVVVFKEPPHRRVQTDASGPHRSAPRTSAVLASRARSCGFRRWRPESRRPSQPVPPGGGHNARKVPQQIQHGAFHREQVRVTPRQGGYHRPPRPGLRRQQLASAVAAVPTGPTISGRLKPQITPDTRAPIWMSTRWSGGTEAADVTSQPSPRSSARATWIKFDRTVRGASSSRIFWFEIDCDSFTPARPEPSIGNRIANLAPLHPIEASALHARRERVSWCWLGCFWVHSPC